MTTRGPFLVLVALLMVLGIGSAVFRHDRSGIPFLPGDQATVWQVEVKVSFRADGGPIQVLLSLPPSQAEYRIINENAVSSGYGFVIDDRDGVRRAHWSKRDAQGEQTLYYKVDLVRDPTAAPPSGPPQVIPPVRLDEPYATAAQAIVAAVLPRSADALTLAQQLIREMTRTPMDQNVALLLDRYSLTALFSDLLALANVPAREVQALILEDGRRRQSLVDLVQVWQNGQWHLFNPGSESPADMPDLLMWQTATPSVLDVIGGSRSRISFSIISQTRPALEMATADAQGMSAPSLSLYSLPVEEQSMFKLIMLLPVGALMVVVLRVLVGLKTSGTFMPVLIALAFLQTQLVPGVIIFVLVVSIGLFIRSYLSTLNLLLVARIATLVIVVVAIMSIVSVLSYRLGLEAGLTITFFPMIILAWTIERMSILWEEDGPKEVLIQGSGSLFVAVAAYLAMDQPLIRHLAFNFPELHLVVLALILMLGRYTGYRLLELRRFSTLMDD
jgi:7 transmembrane helices usually fused to an inactive transglutaminase/Inactive transglutaminase fused to 7 transmembrane helices